MECSDCGVEVNPSNSFKGRCGKCHGEHLRASSENISVDELRASKTKEDQDTNSNKGSQKYRNPSEYRRIVLTTEACVSLKIDERIEIISTEVVVGMNIFKDLFAGVRNVVGGRSNAIQMALKDIRSKALDELKREAFDLEADAVVGVNLNYQDIGATGSTMLMLVATGTAVKLAKD